MDCVPENDFNAVIISNIDYHRLRENGLHHYNHYICCNFNLGLDFIFNSPTGYGHAIIKVATS